MENFAAPGITAPALLPDAVVSAALAARPVRLAGEQPVAAVILLEIDVQPAEAA